MSELGRWTAWVSGVQIGMMFDPLFWIAIALGAGLGMTKRTIAIGLILVLAMAAGGWYLTIQDFIYRGNGSPPLIYGVMYFINKSLGFALGLAFNRVVHRFDKRTKGVLEKART